MDLPVTHTSFQRQRLSVRTAGFFRGPALLLNGQALTRSKGRYKLINDAGAEVTAKLGSNLVDPIPTLNLGGELVRLARPLAWYEYLWGGFPIVLVFVGGALGGVIGILAAFMNARVLRSERRAWMRYALAGATTVMSFVVFFFAAAVLRTLIATATQ